MNDVLLTVSGEIDPDIDGKIARGERPEADYVALARGFGADVIDYTKARQRAGWLGRVLEPIVGPNLILAWACFKTRRSYRVIFTDGEQVGLPLAFFLKFLAPRSKVRHQMIVHILSVWKKTILVDLFRLWRKIDIFFVYSTWQKVFIQKRWPVPEQDVIFTPFMVDSQFFSPDQAGGADLPELEGIQRPLICAVGLEFRDYPTLMEAVKGLDITLIIAAASPWSKRADTTQGQEIPENVIVRRFSQFELRDVYHASSILVMPLYPVNFQAGVTAILEGMSMEIPVICTRTPGQTDVLVAGETGVYVPPEDPEALRAAIVELVGDPGKARKMGENGRQRIIESMSLEQYTRRLSRYVRQEAGHQKTV